jgi:hypothetical protein
MNVNNSTNPSSKKSLKYESQQFHKAQLEKSLKNESRSINMYHALQIIQLVTSDHVDILFHGHMITDTIALYTYTSL